MSGIGPAGIALSAAGGVALGAVYFAVLAWTVRLHTSRAAASAIVALYAARFVLAAGAFWFIAQQGALALLIALAGFLVARIVSQRLVGAG